MTNIEGLFFCRTYDFLHVYIPKVKAGSRNTFATYKQGIKTFRTYVNSVKGIPSREYRFEDCTYDFLLDYRNYLHDVEGLKETTVNNKLAVIKSYVGYASTRDVSLQQLLLAISQVPYYSAPKIRQPIIEDVDALAAILGMPPNTRKGLRDKTIMSTLYDNAMRVDELVSLTVGSVCMDHEVVEIRIHGKGNKERKVVVDEKTSALIRQYAGEYHPDRVITAPFFYTTVGGTCKHMTTRNVQKLVKKYSDKARIDYDIPESVSPHTFRRTRGTLLYRDGVDIEAVAVLLGHSDTKTTRDHYTSPSVQQLREIASRRTEAIPETEQLWPDDEEEMTRILGLD